jgi:hypothetical protein
VTVQGYNLVLADSKERLHRELKLGEWLKTHQKTINALWRKVEGIRSAMPEDRVSYYHDSITSRAAQSNWDQHQVYITISLRQLEGLKDPLLELALTPFIDAPKSRCQDWPQSLNRDYHFSFELEGGTIDVSVSAYVKEENPTCRRILVERKPITTLQEVYKLACDGDIIEGEVPAVKLEAAAADPNVIDV